MPKKAAEPIKIDLNKAELAAFLKWNRKHAKTCPHRNMSLTLIRSHSGGIGPSTDIVCVCGDKVVVTDYASW